MPKSHSEFVCQQCSYKSPSFLGKCPECGEWNSLVETHISDKNLKFKIENFKLEENLVKLSEIRSLEHARIKSGFSEFDRVLGGGIVPGSIILISGDPGIGKSTLLLQAAMRIAQGTKVTKEPFDKAQGKPKETKYKKTSTSSGSSVTSDTSVLYVTGEESPQQVKTRAERIAKSPENLYILPSTQAEAIILSAEKLNPRLIIVDSIQTITCENLIGVAGSVGQVRESASLLARYAKANQTAILIVGHVTKEGNIAGPKVLEHLVDAVLNLEGDSLHAFRILRSAKNRFGSTFEVGVFEMTDSGLKEHTDPSQIFLAQRLVAKAGSVVTSTVAGGRPILAEIQALTTQTIFPVPTRKVSGLDFSRMQIVIAALFRVAKLGLASLDIYVNVAGGLKIAEPAADLGAALAIVSAVVDRPINEGICVFGEVGLLGELRPVGNLKGRESEAKRLGFKDFVTPARFKTLDDAINYAIHGG